MPLLEEMFSGDPIVKDQPKEMANTGMGINSPKSKPNPNSPGGGSGTGFEKKVGRLIGEKPITTPPSPSACQVSNQNTAKTCPEWHVVQYE